MANSLTDNDYKQAAAKIDPKMSPLLLRAFAEVESGGRSGFGASGLPIIAYEGHKFRNDTGGKYDKDYPLLSYKYVKKAGPEWQINNKNQTAAWKTLNAAAALDSVAAQRACSWGMFQVLGSNSSDCGYKDVGAFVTAMKTNEQAHIDAFVAFCLKNGMKKAMLSKDYKTMARIYNGKNSGNYAALIEKAYIKLGGT